MADLKSDVDLLAEGSDDLIINDKPLPKSEPKDDPEDQELAEDEIIPESEGDSEESEDPEEKPEDKDDSEVSSNRPTVKELTTKYPDILKEFPGLRAAIYESHEFNKLFATVDEAKEIIESSEILTSFKDDIFGGNGTKFVDALKEADSLKSFGKSFLNNLYKTDRDAHYEVISPILENIVKAFYEEGKRIDNESVRLSAENLALYLFGSSEIASTKKSIIQQEEKSDSPVKKELEALRNERYNNFRIDVLEKCSDDLRSVIRTTVDKQNISKTLKDLITDKILKEIDGSIQKDSAHMRLIDNLWKKANSNNYSGESKSRIISAYLERAKQLEPSIRRKLLGEVIGNSPEDGQRKREVSEQVQNRREPGSSGKPSGQAPVKAYNARQIDWKKTTDMDFLADNVTVKSRR